MMVFIDADTKVFTTVEVLFLRTMIIFSIKFKRIDIALGDDGQLLLPAETCCLSNGERICYDLRNCLNNLSEHSDDC